MSVINPPGLPALFSSGCICFSGAAEAAGVNVAVKKADSCKLWRSRRGSVRISQVLKGEDKMDLCIFAYSVSEKKQENTRANLSRRLKHADRTLTCLCMCVFHPITHKWGCCNCWWLHNVFFSYKWAIIFFKCFRASLTLVRLAYLYQENQFISHYSSELCGGKQHRDAAESTYSCTQWGQHVTPLRCWAQSAELRAKQR